MSKLMRIYYQVVRRGLLFCILYPLALIVIALIQDPKLSALMPLLTGICIFMVFLELVRKGNRIGDVGVLIFVSMILISIEPPLFSVALLKQNSATFLIHLSFTGAAILSLVDLANITYKKYLIKKKKIETPSPITHKKINFSRIWIVTFSLLTLLSLGSGLWSKPSTTKNEHYIWNMSNFKLPTFHQIKEAYIHPYPTSEKEQNNNPPITLKIKDITLTPISNS